MFAQYDMLIFFWEEFFPLPTDPRKSWKVKGNDNIFCPALVSNCRTCSDRVTRKQVSRRKSLEKSRQKKNSLYGNGLIIDKLWKAGLLLKKLLNKKGSVPIWYFSVILLLSYLWSPWNSIIKSRGGQYLQQGGGGILKIARTQNMPPLNNWELQFCLPPEPVH